MKRVGILNKSTNRPVRCYPSKTGRFKTFSEYPETDFAQFEITDETSENAYFWNGTQVIFDPEFTEINRESFFCKIYRYINKAYEYNKIYPPKGHNYVTGLDSKLFRKDYFNKGELYMVDWFADQALTDIVLKAEMVYVRDNLGFAESRTTTRTWYKENNEAHPDTKITPKDYNINNLDKIKEGIRRRTNLVNGLQYPVLGAMTMTIPLNEGETAEEFQTRVLLLGREFLGRFKDDFTKFKEDSNKAIITSIENATDEWLENIMVEPDTTIRQYILNELS